ncbi:cache domain-containing protein [Wukongibacter baidiensis]|uniref:cache domain-containing protein n=1 Tax=Wukongibacter baidiensis TaxID=1723361 RepID=UPI003D7FD90B
MKSKVTKLFFLVLSIVLTINIAGCKLTLKAGVVKHDKKAVEPTEQVIDYKDELEYIQSRFDSLEKSLLASEINEEPIVDIFEGFISELEIEFEYLYFTTENEGKTFLFPETPLPKGYDGRKRPWYVQSKEKNYYVSEIYKNVGSDENILTYAKALYKGDELLGVAGIDIVIK